MVLGIDWTEPNSMYPGSKSVPNVVYLEHLKVSPPTILSAPVPVKHYSRYSVLQSILSELGTNTHYPHAIITHNHSRHKPVEATYYQADPCKHSRPCHPSPATCPRCSAPAHAFQHTLPRPSRACASSAQALQLALPTRSSRSSPTCTTGVLLQQNCYSTVTVAVL